MIKLCIFNPSLGVGNKFEQTFHQKHIPLSSPANFKGRFFYDSTSSYYSSLNNDYNSFFQIPVLCGRNLLGINQS